MASGWIIPESKIEEEFALIDKDGNGSIDKSELLTVIKEMYAKYNLEADPEVRVKGLLKNADENGDGKITIEEFRKAFATKVE